MHLGDGVHKLALMMEKECHPNDLGSRVKTFMTFKGKMLQPLNVKAVIREEKSDMDTAVIRYISVGAHCHHQLVTIFVLLI